MGTQTFSATIHLLPDGTFLFSSWQAEYAANGRQLPHSGTRINLRELCELQWEWGRVLDEALLAYTARKAELSPPIPGL